MALFNELRNALVSKIKKRDNNQQHSWQNPSTNTTWWEETLNQVAESVNRFEPISHNISLSRATPQIDINSLQQDIPGQNVNIEPVLDTGNFNIPVSSWVWVWSTLSDSLITWWLTSWASIQWFSWPSTTFNSDNEKREDLKLWDNKRVEDRENELTHWENTVWRDIRWLAKWLFNLWGSLIKGKIADKENEFSKEHTFVWRSNVWDVYYIDFAWKNDDLKNSSQTKFLTLYNDFDSAIQQINNSWLNDEQKQVAIDEAYNNFKQQAIRYLWINWVNSRDMTRYIDVTHNYTWNLNELPLWNKDNITINDEAFWDFVDKAVINYNNQVDIQTKYWLDEIDDSLINSYQFDDETLANLKHSQVDDVMQPISKDVQLLIKWWLITPDKWHEIENRFDNVINERVNTMWDWMWNSVGYYSKVKDKKDAWLELTEWEEWILEHGRYLSQIMDNYMNAVQQRGSETIRQKLSDWEIIAPADNINWVDINTFFNDAVEQALTDAWLDEWIQSIAASLWNSSAIDKMQLLNNLYWNKYWQDKWDTIQTIWQNVQNVWWWVWFVWWELVSDAAVWYTRLIEMLGSDANLSQYTRADFTYANTIATDRSELWELTSQFWNEVLENVPEIIWTLWAPKIGWLWLNKLSKFTRVENALNRINKAANATKIKTLNRMSSNLSKIQRGAASRQAVNDIMQAFNATTKEAVSQAPWLTNKQRFVNWVAKNGKKVINSLQSETSKNWIDFASSVIKNAAVDQIYDASASYYDTEAYSPTSFSLSLWMTALTEWMIPTLKSLAGFWLSKINNTNAALQSMSNWLTWWWENTWSMIKFMDEHPDEWEIMKQIYKAMWLWDLDLKKYQQLSWQWWKVEWVVNRLYNEMNDWWKMRINWFTKNMLFNEISKIFSIDWNSTYWKRLITLMNSDKSNPADVIKYMLGIPSKVEFWPFTSTIQFKEGVNEATQTRRLRWNYNIALDNIDWQFMSKLRDWFTLEDIKQIQERTSFNDVVENWKVNEKYFSFDDKSQKYILNTDGAKAFDVTVAEYSDAMAKADLIKQSAEQTEQQINDILQKLWKSKWLSENTIKWIASSWTLDNTAELLAKIVCE